MTTKEIKKLPDSWQWARLGDVCKIETGTTPSRSKPEFFGEGLPWVTPGDFDGSMYISKGREAITEVGILEGRGKTFPAKTVLLVCIGATIGKVAVAAIKISANQQINALICRVKLYPEFLYFYLVCNKANLVSVASSSTVAIINQERLGTIEIPLPPLAEQKWIAAIAKKADQLRRTRRYALQLSDTYVRSVFLEMFGDCLTKDYPNTPLGELVTISGGGTPAREVPSYYTGNIPWITAKDMQWDYIIDSQEHISEEGIKKSATKLIPKGSILMVVKSKVLMHRLPLAIAKRELCHNQDIKSVQCSKKVNSYFLLYVLKYNEPQLLRHARGANTEGLTLPMLEAVPVPDVSLTLQEKFAQIVQKFDRLRTQQQEADRQAEHLFHTLLHRAFRGELTSQNADDEPESVLLEEIRAQQAKAEAKTAIQAMGDVADYLGTKVKQQDIEPIQLKFPGFE